MIIYQKTDKRISCQELKKFNISQLSVKVVNNALSVIKRLG